MIPPRGGAATGDALRSPDAEWEALRARLEAFQRELCAARAGDDTAALRTACADGLEVLADMEALVGRLITRAPHTRRGRLQ